MARLSRSRPAPVELRRAFEASEVLIPPADLVGTLRLPLAHGPIVVFVQVGGGDDVRRSNMMVADAFNQHGLGTLLFDLRATGEAIAGGDVCDIPRLAQRAIAAVQWIAHEPAAAGRAIGLFAAGSASAVALVAAAKCPGEIGAVVSSDGRPDLAEEMLDLVRAPTLLIVGGLDPALELNRQAFARLQGPKVLEIVPEARHQFIEPGALDMAIVHATRWFEHYLHRGRVQAKRR